MMKDINKPYGMLKSDEHQENFKKHRQGMRCDGKEL